MGKIYTDINDYETLNEQTQEAISQTLDDLATNHDTY
jgi:hypothetical protein